MNKKQIKKLELLNQDYKVLKEISSYVMFEQNKKFFLFGIFIFPFIDIFLLLTNSFIKNEILTEINKISSLTIIEIVFIISILVLTFFMIALTYCSYYFTLKNINKKNISNLAKKRIKGFSSFSEYESEIINLKKNAITIYEKVK